MQAWTTSKSAGFNASMRRSAVHRCLPAAALAALPCPLRRHPILLEDLVETHEPRDAVLGQRAEDAHLNLLIAALPMPNVTTILRMRWRACAADDRRRNAASVKIQSGDIRGARALLSDTEIWTFCLGFSMTVRFIK